MEGSVVPMVQWNFPLVWVEGSPVLRLIFDVLRLDFVLRRYRSQAHLQESHRNLWIRMPLTDVMQRRLAFHSVWVARWQRLKV